MKKNLWMAVALVGAIWQGASAAGVEALPKPGQLKADLSKCGAVTLSWQAVSGAQGFHLVVMSGGVGSEKDVTGTFVTFDQMKPGVHSFKVKANGVRGQSRDSEFSEALSFEVRACEVCTPPVVKLTMVTPTVIWPPNHKMVSVSLSGDVKTNCPLTEASFLVKDEYGRDVVGALPVAPTGGPFCVKAFVEADRLGTDKDGRHYGFSAMAKNKAGAGVSATLESVVPHDMGR